ncbi:ABC transporter ATP-binding protein [Fundicoccus culcitae]|uniref:ATP-binding cassette domain-containing protein n=1 Tax=Fundicoccus culcitae TaxID=2969821 RepID=A0ABY5P861_9LACT|nr:ATP-binding cassette domain-containing protein [Fundicoccus culcitae]UUX34929.1 ATP-binding cassette domain-containing protein [Fundicoccus culcitae]
MKIIEVKNISKKYGNAVVIDDVSCSFEEGKIHGIIGRNGAGKTLLMKSICGFILPDEGEIIVRGKSLSNKKNTIPEDFGIIIESPGFLPAFTGYGNLKYLASLQGKIGKAEIEEVLDTVGLGHAKGVKVSKYSMGMRQRLGIAQAIMENQSILVLDEPMNGLDNQGVKDMRKLFLSLKEEGKTILLASHNREDIMVLCDSVMEMDHGKVIDLRYQNPESISS